MRNDFLEGLGSIDEVQNLSIPLAVEFIRALAESPYCDILEVRKKCGAPELECVIFYTDVQVGQHPKHPILDREELCAVFGNNGAQPKVFALREDFPKTPHQQLEDFDYPRSLCLYELPFEEIELHLTGISFLSDIRRWLRLTASGRLHAADQPLEPILQPGNLYLVIDTKFTEAQALRQPLLFKEINLDFAKTLIPITDTEKASATLALAIYMCQPMQHGIISKKPKCFSELHDLLAKSGENLLEAMRGLLKEWYHDHHEVYENRKLKFGLLLSLPKTRAAGGHVESYEFRAFSGSSSVDEVAQEIGILSIKDKTLALLLRDDESMKGNKIEFEVLNVLENFSVPMARRMSGLTEKVSKNITIIGTGALGSQIAENLGRMGAADLMLIDKDIMLPHNLARHSLGREFVGTAKSLGLMVKLGSILNNYSALDCAICDILKPGQFTEKVKAAVSKANLVVDCSTSIAVARKISEDSFCNCPRVSIFLNPSGTDLVVLAEDWSRTLKLDYLEMAYYRCLLNDPNLVNHLTDSSGEIRYGSSCRDLSSIIPQDHITLHAALATRTILKLIDSHQPMAGIWNFSAESFSVHYLDIPYSTEIRCRFQSWTLCTDELLLKKISGLRAAKLPNETGGVLLGSYNVRTKTVYVVDSILAPPDSEEYPFAFIRGYRGQAGKIEKVQKTTAQNLTYVGEWHSHPDGIGIAASQADTMVFEWIRDNLEREGLPPLMLIAGDNKAEFYIEKI